MAFDPRRFFRNAFRGEWQRATDTITEGFRAVETESVQFDLTPTETVAVGKMVWNPIEGTVDLGMIGGNVVNSLGQELVVYAVNKTGATITNGQVVRLVGSQGQRVEIALATAATEEGSSKTLGVATEDIENNAQGFVTLYGIVHGIDTNALTEGALVWLSTTSGAMTSTMPTQPNHGVLVGVCLKKAGGAGSVFVKIQNGYELNEIHNVLISNPQNGDVLKYDSASGLWKNAPA